MEENFNENQNERDNQNFQEEDDKYDVKDNINSEPFNPYQYKECFNLYRTQNNNENINQIGLNRKDNLNRNLNLNPKNEPNINEVFNQTQNPFLNNQLNINPLIHQNTMPNIYPVLNRTIRPMSVPFLQPFYIEPNANQINAVDEYSNNYTQNNVGFAQNLDNYLLNQYNYYKSNMDQILQFFMQQNKIINNDLFNRNILLNSPNINTFSQKSNLSMANKGNILNQSEFNRYNNNIIPNENIKNNTNTYKENKRRNKTNAFLQLNKINTPEHQFIMFNNTITDLNNLKLPDITKNIIDKVKEKFGREITDEEKKLLNGDDINQDNKIYFNKYMFYSSNKISLYFPHILKEKNDITSILLSNEKLDKFDFQYTYFDDKIYEDIFLLLLQKRIDEYNNYVKKDGKIVDDKYNEKIFGFNTDKNGNSYLYTTMDEEIILEKLKENNTIILKNNLIGRQSQISSQNRSSYLSEIFNYNMNYLQGLTFEELIFYIILDKLNKKYEVFPRILFYEYFLTINNDRIILANINLPGYSEIDYVLYSNITCDFREENPLIVQTCYSYNVYKESKKDIDFKIIRNTLYFFELKTSSNAIYKNNDFLNTLFNKYYNLLHLYKTKNWIKENTKKHIMLIYDSQQDRKIEALYEGQIWDFLKNNKDCTFSIVYAMKTYPYFSHSIALKKYDEIKKENIDLKNRVDILQNKLDKLDKFLNINDEK